MSNNKQQHDKAFDYAMDGTPASSSAMRTQKRTSKKNVIDSAKEFQRLQNEGGAQTGRLLQLSQAIHLIIHDKTVFDSSSNFFESLSASFATRQSNVFIWEERDGLIETIKVALNYPLHYHVSKATKILLAAKNSVKAVDQKIKWFGEAEKVLKDASSNGDLLSVLSDHDELRSLYIEVQSLLPGHFSDNELAMTVFNSGNSNTSKVGFKSESLAFNQETESKEVTIAKTLSESCAQSKNCDNKFIDNYSYHTPTKSRNYNEQLQTSSSIIPSSSRGGCTSGKRENPKSTVKFGQVNEALFELEPGSADSVPADSQYKFCKGGFALQLAGKAIERSSYPCRSQHSSVSHMNLSERRDRYENAGLDGLLNTVDELQDRIKIVQDERDRYKAKSETFEVRSETAIEALNVQGGGGDAYTHLVNQYSILRTKYMDLEVNQELAKQRVAAFSDENNRLNNQLFRDLSVQRSDKQRSRGSTVKPVKTYDKQDTKRMRFK